jgi:kynurenine formamidase
MFGTALARDAHSYRPSYTIRMLGVVSDNFARIDMTTKTRWYVLVACLIIGSCSRPGASELLSGARWVDLSYAFDSATIYWPTAAPFKLEVVSAQRTPAGFWYAANNFTAAEHGGTHLDAPVHFSEGKETADRIPLEHLSGPAVVIDTRGREAADRDYLISESDIKMWEQQHGAIPAGAVVLLRTGRGAFWPDRAAYLGTVRTGPAAVAELHFPGLDPAAARLLVQRRVDAVGIDTPSIDYGQSTTFETHQVLAAQNIPIFENVAQLDQVPVTGAFVIGLPMKIGGGSGGPLRLVAILGS